MTADPSWLSPATPGPQPQAQQQQPQWLKPPAPEQPPAWLKTTQQSAAQPQQQNQDPANFRKWLTGGGLYGQNPGVNVMQDYGQNWTKFGGGGIRPEFRAIVQGLVNKGNSLGVYDFDKGHHYAPNDPHLDGRAMDVDTVNKEPVGTRLSPNLGQFINQALQSDPRVRLGVPKEIYNQLGSLTGNGRIFVDAPAHIHVEFDPMSAAPGKAPAVKGFTPDQPKLGKPQEAGVGQALGGILQKVGGAVEEAGKGFTKGLHYAMGHPLESYSDVEGVLQRAVTGYMSKEAPGQVPMPTGVAVGQAIYDAFHPHSAEVQKRDDSTAIRGLFEPFGIKEAKDGTWAHFGQAIAAQSATDPFTYLMPMLRGGAAIADMGKIAEGVEGIPEVSKIIAAKQALLQKTGLQAAGKFINNHIGIRPELNDYLEGHAKDARMMYEDAATEQSNAGRYSDEQLLSQHEGELRNVQGTELPEPIRQRYLQEPYVYGTPEMREQAVRLGYKPTPEEVAKAPQGLLHYNLRDDYQTLIRPPAGETEEQAFQRISGGEPSKENSGFEKERDKNAPMGTDQYDVTENRLRLGRNLVRRRQIDQQTSQYLEKYGGWKPDAPIKDIGALSDNPWKIHTAVGDFFNKLSRESIKVFPFPHAIGNVGQLAWNKGGWTAVGKGLMYSVKGLSDAQVERLRSMGLWAEYLGKDATSPWQKPPLSKLPGSKGVDKAIDVSTSILNRLEAGFRQGLLDLADHQYGFDPKNIPNEVRKAKDVRDAIGDYRNVSKVVATLQGVVGAPFVAFGLSIVPKAITKAIREHPERLAGNARMMQDLQQEHGGPLPAGLKVGGGPNERFAKMIADPTSLAISPSILGPYAMPINYELRTHFGLPTDLKQMGGESLQQYGGPIGNVASGVAGLAHPAPGEKPGLNEGNLRAALLDWMSGRYLKNEPSQRSEDYFNRTEESGSYPKKIHHRHFSQ